jgi:hypothetical protein
MIDTNENHSPNTSRTTTDSASGDAHETPQSGLSILRNIALYLLVPIGVLLLIKILTE